MSIVSLFCDIDDFYLATEKQMPFEDSDSDTPESRGRPRNLHPSEVMTILVNFHQDFQCKGAEIYSHTENPSARLKKRCHASIPRPRAYLGHDPTSIYRRHLYRRYGNQSTNIGLTSD